MSVNVYLKDEIRQAEGFKMKQMSGGKPLQTWEEPTYNGIELSGRRQGRLYLEFRELEDKIPEVFNPFVEEVSYQESFAINSRRSIGIYRREKIVAELDTSEFNRERYTVKMRGSMEDMPTMLELYRAIRAGTISPLPGDREGVGEDQGRTR
ncbi:MAG: hypothetical protein K0S38_771 [Candidatus Paceibacter sp.]|nr:hypothetical protein [Candidatus Paceibacter sp.]